MLKKNNHNHTGLTLIMPFFFRQARRQIFHFKNCPVEVVVLHGRYLFLQTTVHYGNVVLQISDVERFLLIPSCCDLDLVCIG